MFHVLIISFHLAGLSSLHNKKRSHTSVTKIGIGKYCNNHHHHHYSSANLFYAVFCKKRTKPSSNDNLNSKVLNVAGTNKNTPQNTFSILHVIFYTLALFGRDHNSQVIFGSEQKAIHCAIPYICQF